MIWLLVAIVLVLLFLWLKGGSSTTSFSSPDPNDVEESERTKIIEDYGIVMEQLVGKNFFVIYNENNLPSSKSIIKNALLLELRKYPYDFWQENGKEMYETLLFGLFTLIWFQPDLSDRELRIPDVDKEDLSKLGNERSMILVNYINSIIEELKQTIESLVRLRIQMEPSGKVDGMYTGIVLFLSLAKKKLEEQA